MPTCSTRGRTSMTAQTPAKAKALHGSAANGIGLH